MKWLHLSDLHFDPENAGLGTTMLRKELPAYLKDSGIKADHLFFTGDFRNAARQEDSDEVAKEAAEFLLRIAESVGITDSSRIHIVPGNHDLTRVGYEKANPDETDEEKQKREKAKEEGKKQVEAIRQTYESADGLFDKDSLDHLLGRFGFFRRMVKALSPEADVWKNSLLPLHPYRCLDDFSLVYMNTAVTCQKGDEDRGNLVMGTTDLYNSLKTITEKNSGKPVIILAHHSPHYFSNNELQKIETIFQKFPDVALYLCGDAHKPWSRAVNTLPQFTAGCLNQSKETEVVFYTGELCNGKFLPPKAHSWDQTHSRWGVYSHADAHILEMISGANNPFFSLPQINIVSNLDTLGIRLAQPFIGREKEL
ncbi:metallophosphoesterase, partial [Desulfosarcina sp. OttesenSCG-928-A07]|nr:metallophosphoesterase [Desulfosarcina sp. OttesenSCG-928-A07]